MAGFTKDQKVAANPVLNLMVKLHKINFYKSNEPNLNLDHQLIVKVAIEEANLQKLFDAQTTLRNLGIKNRFYFWTYLPTVQIIIF